MKKNSSEDWLQIFLLFLLIIFFGTFFAKINFSNPSSHDYVYIVILILIFFLLFGFLYKYLKNEKNKENKELILGFIRVLLPFLLGISSLIYVIKSDLFSLQREKAQAELKELDGKRSKLDLKIESLNRAFEKVNTEKIETEKLLSLSRDSISMLPEKDEALINLSRGKIKLKKEISKLQLINKTLGTLGIEKVNNIDLNSNKFIFTLRHKFSPPLTPDDLAHPVYFEIEFKEGVNREFLEAKFNNKTNTFEVLLSEKILKRKKDILHWEISAQRKNAGSSSYGIRCSTFLPGEYTIRIYY